MSPIANSAGTLSYPLPFPVDEKPLLPEEPFASACLEHIGPNWRLGPPVLTQSEEWGKIWRADGYLVIPNFPALGLPPSRIVCWQSPGKDIDFVVYDTIRGKTMPPLKGM